MSGQQPKQFRADLDPAGGAGVASSSLQTSHQQDLAQKKAAIAAAKKTGEVAVNAIPVVLKSITSPGGVAALGVVGIGILLHTLFSMSPSAQLAEQNRTLNKMLANQQQTNEQILDTMTEMNKTATRPTVNVGLVQWGMKGSEPGYSGNTQRTQTISTVVPNQTPDDARAAALEDQYFMQLSALLVNNPGEFNRTLEQWRPAIQAGDQAPVANALRRVAEENPNLVRL